MIFQSKPHQDTSGYFRWEIIKPHGDEKNRSNGPFLGK